MSNQEQKFCRACGSALLERTGVNLAIFAECPNGPFGNHDYIFTGRYAKPKFDPITGERNADE